MRFTPTLIAVVLCSCASGQSRDGAAARQEPGSGATPAAGSGQIGDEETEIVETTPMGLLGPEFFAAAGTRLEQVGISAPSESVSQASGSTDGVEVDQEALAIQLINVPNRAVAQMRELIAKLERLFEQLFGARGYFGVNDFEVRRRAEQTEARRICRLPVETGAELAIITSAVINGAIGVREYPHSVEIFARGQRTLRLEFQGQRGDASSLRARILYALPELDGTTSRVEATLDRAASHLSVAFGATPADPKVPSRNVVDFDFAAPDLTETAGALIWGAQPGLDSSVVVPRYQNLGTRDISLFQALDRLDDAQVLTAQRLALVPGSPGDQTAAAAIASGAKAFEDHALAPLALEFIARVTQDPAIHADCAHAGAAIRSRFANGAMPEAVAALPDDLCATNPQASPKIVGDGIAAGCAQLKSLELKIKSGSRPESTVDLCSYLLEAAVLANPQLLVLDTLNKTRQLKAKQSVSADHLALAAELGARPLVDLASVLDDWAPLVSLSAELGALAEKAGPCR